MIIDILVSICILAVLIAVFISLCSSIKRDKKLDEQKLKNLEAEYEKIKNEKD